MIQSRRLRAGCSEPFRLRLGLIAEVTGAGSVSEYCRWSIRKASAAVIRVHWRSFAVKHISDNGDTAWSSADMGTAIAEGCSSERAGCVPDLSGWKNPCVPSRDG